MAIHEGIGDIIGLWGDPFSPSSLAPINWTCFLSAEPFPTTLCLTSGGEYSVQATLRKLAARRTDPRTLATSIAVVLFTVNRSRSVSAIASGLCSSKMARVFSWAMQIPVWQADSRSLDEAEIDHLQPRALTSHNPISDAFEAGVDAEDDHGLKIP